jgi:hypothetical protein
MSNRWDQHGQADEVATRFERGGHSGQGHDRIHGDNLIPGVSSTIGMSGDMGNDMDDVEIDITAGQKMISAMSGSLLTSLLGWSYRKESTFNMLTFVSSHPPRCCTSPSPVPANGVTSHSHSKSCNNFTPTRTFEYFASESRCHSMLSGGFLFHEQCRILPCGSEDWRDTWCRVCCGGDTKEVI